MSVLIKGMEMPEEGSWVTLRVFPDGKCFLYSWCGNDFNFMEYLTAVPVPPHGRLIDADALISRCQDEKGSYYGHDSAVIGEAVESAPTVIEAEEGE